MAYLQFAEAGLSVASKEGFRSRRVGDSHPETTEDYIRVSYSFNYWLVAGGWGVEHNSTPRLLNGVPFGTPTRRKLDNASIIVNHCPGCSGSLAWLGAETAARLTFQ